VYSVAMPDVRLPIIRYITGKGIAMQKVLLLEAWEMQIEGE
jgi:hypothetical protein